MSYYSGTVNAFPKGGTSSTDDRAGLGIGSLVKGPASGLGSNWSMGDALSSPKGEWDDEINDLEKAIIEKEIQELEGQESDTTKEQLSIAKAKIDALSSDFYQKI